MCGELSGLLLYPVGIYYYEHMYYISLQNTIVEYKGLYNIQPLVIKWWEYFANKKQGIFNVLDFMDVHDEIVGVGKAPRMPQSIRFFYLRNLQYVRGWDLLLPESQGIGWFYDLKDPFGVATNI